MACAATASGKADLVVSGGTVYTMDEKGSRAGAVAVRGGRIVWVGDADDAKEWKGPDTRWLDVEGLTVLPGLIDGHGHLMNLGRLLATLDLRGTSSAAEVRQRVLERQQHVPPGSWIRGRGWDQNDWDVHEFPTTGMLEGTEANPVYLRRVGGHACWVNATALEMAGVVAKTPDPPGGRIVRDEKGRPTGVLIDKAEDLIEAKIPAPSREEKKRRLRLAVRECQRWGLTGVHDGHTAEEELEILHELLDGGQLGLRIYVILDSDEVDFAWRRIAEGPTSDPGRMITVRAVKLYADGALGSRGAALLAPYEDEPEHSGLLITQPDELRSWVAHAARHGFQPCTHAIGDRGNRVTLDVYEEVIREMGLVDHRFRIEHAQVLALDDIGRFSRSGIIPVVQPTHATSDMYWAEDRVGKDRIQGAYAWRKLVDSGCRLPCGSDFPVEAVNPLWGLYAAVTRQDHRGWPDGGWLPGERLTMDEAVRGFTIHAAYAEFAEHFKGSIETGKIGDLTVIEVDPFEVDPDDLVAAKTRYTILAGEIVYRAEAEPGTP